MLGKTEREEKRREGEEEEGGKEEEKEKEKQRYGDYLCMEIVWVFKDNVWIISKEKVYGMVWNCC